MSSSLTEPGAAVRRVACTYCAGVVDVALRAMSVFCPHCNKRLVLEDFTIDSYYAVREFFTCGDIVVGRKGHVVAPIRAGRLTVKGKVQGCVSVRGAVQIKKTGQFKGELRAPSLVIEEGAVFDGVVCIGDVPIPDSSSPSTE